MLFSGRPFALLRTKEGIPSRLKITPLAPSYLKRGIWGRPATLQGRAFLSLRGTIVPKQSRGEAKGITTADKVGTQDEGSDSFGSR